MHLKKITILETDECAGWCVFKHFGSERVIVIKGNTGIVIFSFCFWYIRNFYKKSVDNHLFLGYTTLVRIEMTIRRDAMLLIDYRNGYG